MNKKYTDYLQSPEWAKIRNDLYTVRGKKCERCDSVKYINVHHLHYDNIFQEEPKDLEILCRACHKKEHGITKKEKPKVVIVAHRVIIGGNKPKLKTRKRKLSLAEKVNLSKRKKKNISSVKGSRKYFAGQERKIKKFAKSNINFR